MHKAKRVQALDGYSLSIEFEGGKKAIVDMEDRLFGPVFEPLRDPTFFRQATIDEFGVICWPNGADLAPDGALIRAACASLR